MKIDLYPLIKTAIEKRSMCNPEKDYNKIDIDKIVQKTFGVESPEGIIKKISGSIKDFEKGLSWMLKEQK